MAGAFLVYAIPQRSFCYYRRRRSKTSLLRTSPAIAKPVSNIISEIIGTFVLVFVVFYISDANISIPNTPDVKIGLGTVGAIPVAFLVWAIGLSLGGTNRLCYKSGKRSGTKNHACYFTNKRQQPMELRMDSNFRTSYRTTLAALLFEF